MAQTQIRGSSQIIDGTITAAKLVTGLNLASSQLADAATFVRSGGSIAFTASQSMGGFNLTNVADPVGQQDAATLKYVQSLVNGIAIKPTCRLVSVGNVALTGLLTIDSATAVAGDRILLTAQTTASQNGPWVASASAWTRPLDWASGSSQKEGVMVIVAEGTTYHDTKWLGVTYGTSTVDTTATTWTQDLSGVIYSNGSGLSLTGATFAVKTGNGIAFDGSSNVTITPYGTSLNVSSSGIKITDGTSGQLMLAGTAGTASFATVSGDVTITGTGVTTVSSTSGSGFVKYGAGVYNETPTGSINSSNTSFTLANSPASSSLELFYNGVMLEPGTGNDYTISGVTITTLFTAVTGDKLRAYYIK